MISRRLESGKNKKNPVILQDTYKDSRGTFNDSMIDFNRFLLLSFTLLPFKSVSLSFSPGLRFRDYSWPFFLLILFYAPAADLLASNLVIVVKHRRRESETLSNYLSVTEFFLRFIHFCLTVFPYLTYRFLSPVDIIYVPLFCQNYFYYFLQTHVSIPWISFSLSHVGFSLSLFPPDTHYSWWCSQSMQLNEIKSERSKVTESFSYLLHRFEFPFLFVR